MAEEHMLTTSDNPWNPFTHYDEWNTWDTSHGYNSASLLGRIAVVSNDLQDADYERAIEDAIDEIVKNNITGVFIKATRPSTKELSDATN